jgi:DNA-binding MarR family transcriptional regulator
MRYTRDKKERVGGAGGHVQYKHMSEILYKLHGILLDLIGTMNSPQAHAVLLEEAEVDLDRARFPLLVRIDHRGPISVGDLSESIGRDYTTVSRQAARLEELGLVVRRSNEQDRRIREAAITDQGREMIDNIYMARERLYGSLLSSWSDRDKDKLISLLRVLADEAIELTRLRIKSA